MSVTDTKKSHCNLCRASAAVPSPRTSTLHARRVLKSKRHMSLQAAPVSPPPRIKRPTDRPTCSPPHSRSFDSINAKQYGMPPQGNDHILSSPGRAAWADEDASLGMQSPTRQATSPTAAKRGLQLLSEMPPAPVTPDPRWAAGGYMGRYTDSEESSEHGYAVPGGCSSRDSPLALVRRVVFARGGVAAAHAMFYVGICIQIQLLTEQ